jgi:purine-binding chemotaxis protein CheW
MASQPTVAEQAQYLGFQIAGEEYAIGILRVREILEYDTLTKVPTTPPSIRGVINLRGSVVPVVDLAVKFGLPESVVSKRTCIVVVEVDLDGERAVMGVLADAVSQVFDLPASEVEPPPPFGTRVRVDCLIGMGRAGRKFVLLLDIDKLLSLDELEMTRQEGPTVAVPPEVRRDRETSPAERDQPVPPTEMSS